MVSTEQYINNLENQFHKSFKRLTDLRLSETSILLFQPNSSVYRTEFICGQMGSLLVHGDGPDILLRTYRNVDLRYKLEFLAKNGYGYLSEKVVMGEYKVFDIDVFHHDIDLEIDMHIRENTDDEGVLDEYTEETVDMLRSIKADTGCEWSFRQAVWDYYPSELDYPDHLGRVPSPNLIMAKMAAKRVLELLDDQ